MQASGCRSRVLDKWVDGDEALKSSFNGASLKDIHIYNKFPSPITCKRTRCIMPRPQID